MPGGNESYQYREAGLSQQACAISSEASSRFSCWNVEGTYSNLSCTVVMEEGRQKSKRLSYAAKFIREVIQCAQEKGNPKATAIFGVDESNIRLWRKHKTVISGCEASWRKFTGPKKGRFPEIDDTVFMFFQDKLLYCIVLTARTAALSFFQNPALDHESNLHMIMIHIWFFTPLKL